MSGKRSTIVYLPVIPRHITRRQVLYHCQVSIASSSCLTSLMCLCFFFLAVPAGGCQLERESRRRWRQPLQVDAASAHLLPNPIRQAVVGSTKYVYDCSLSGIFTIFFFWEGEVHLWHFNSFQWRNVQIKIQVSVL